MDDFHFRRVPNLPADSLVLDLGGNRIRKRGQFDVERHGLRVVYANLTTAKRPDVQSDAASLPFREGVFDAVICSELLEHVADPVAVLREVYRVLRRGGTLLICAPFLHRIHADPYDYGRYTDHFWSGALREIGFCQIVVERQGLFFSVLADFLKQYLSAGGPGRPFGRVARWLMPRFQRWALTRDQEPKVQASPFFRSFTTGFGIQAVK